MGPNAGVDYNLILCPLKSRLQHIYHGIGQPYARVDLNPMPESTLTLCQSRLYPLAKDFGFGLCICCWQQLLGREERCCCMIVSRSAYILELLSSPQRSCFFLPTVYYIYVTSASYSSSFYLDSAIGRFLRSDNSLTLAARIKKENQ